jgi:hypothetical protein
MMIQLNTNAISGAQGGNSPATPANTNGASFQNALQAAVSATLKEYGIDPSQVTVSIGPSTTDSSGASAGAPDSTIVSPFSRAAAIAAYGPGATPAASPEASSTTGPVSSSPGTPPSAPGSSNGASGSSSEDPNQAFDDAYWAKQPQAVQALRTMSNYAEKTKAAAALAAQGYTIDVPIMVWGWDPAKITTARQSYGYTWVPSALQPDVAEAPGMNLPGMTAYDPKNPPSGSVAV